MRRRAPITSEEENEIIAALEKDAHATRVAGQIGCSFSTVWRVADRACIELTAGREAKGYKRLSADRQKNIEQQLRADPKLTQEDVARATGVSRSTVGRIERRIRQSTAAAPAG
jgi:CRP-like cAMP-binding protein